MSRCKSVHIYLENKYTVINLLRKARWYLLVRLISLLHSPVVSCLKYLCFPSLEKKACFGLARLWKPCWMSKCLAFPKARPRILLLIRVGSLGTRASGGRRDRRSPCMLLSGSLNSYVVSRHARLHRQHTKHRTMAFPRCSLQYLGVPCKYHGI